MTEPERKVVGFRGAKAYAPGEPISEVVQIIEAALEEAKSGNVRAVAITYVIACDTSAPVLCEGFWGESGRARELYMGMGKLMRRIERWIDG